MPQVTKHVNIPQQGNLILRKMTATKYGNRKQGELSKVPSNLRLTLQKGPNGLNLA